MERHRRRGEVPDYLAKGGHPLGAQHQIVPCKRHYKQVDVEVGAVDDDWRGADDARTRDALAVGDDRREPRSGLHRKPRAWRGAGRDEVVGRPTVEEGDEWRTADGDCDLQRPAARYAGHRVQGEDRRFRGRLLMSVGGGVVVELHPGDVEDAPANTVVPPGVALVAVVAEAKAAAFRLFLLGEALRLAALALVGDRRCLVRVRRGCRQSRTRLWGAQDAAARSLGRRGRVFGHELELPCQTHGGRHGLGVLHLDLEAKRWQEPAGVELDLLGLLQFARAGQQRLPLRRVLRDRPGPAAGRELEERSRAERWPEPQIDEVLEAWPCRSALILLNLHEPQLGVVVEVVRSHPDALLRHNPLLQEKGFALVDEGERISLAIVARHLRAPMLGGAIWGLLAGVVPWAGA